MTEDSECTPRFLQLGNGNYGKWSIHMEAELIQKSLWDMVFVEVNTDGKTDDKVKAELQKLVAKRSVNLRWRKCRQKLSYVLSGMTNLLTHVIMIPRLSETGRRSL